MDQGHRSEYGFDLKIKRSELIKLLEDRANHHEGRAKFYKTKGGEFADDREKVDQGASNRTMGRHQEEINRSSEMHQKQAKMLWFFAAHLPKDRIITLTRKDVYEMELLEA
jgi:hypothetical protein